MKVNLFWFRRDLRIHDNCGLYHALKSGVPTVPVFIFDTDILDKLDNKKDGRVQFILDTIRNLHRQLDKYSSSIEIYYGTPEESIGALLTKYDVQAVYTNNDYENYAVERDARISKLLSAAGITFSSYKDHVIFEKNEVVKDNGQPYTVFTPYSRKWLGLLSDFYLQSYPVNRYVEHFYKFSSFVPSLKDLGFEESEVNIPSAELNIDILKHYEKLRNIPSANGTSRIGIHLRFGTVSIREIAHKARELNPLFLNELIWRDFYQAIAWHFPHIGKGHSFKPKYDLIAWRNNEIEFSKWCRGETGYPIVDAGIRQLNSTGFMHNRVRMIVASFLSKHLLIDWRWGEAYFAERLLDYDFAANNGGWQWAAGCGCDAAPYFRIFNPYLQTKKFDNEHEYINHWVPELNEFNYPPPVVEHEFARKRCLEVYKKALED